MYPEFGKRYFASEMARQEGHRRGALTNPKQPVKNPSFVDPHGVGARYLPWDLSAKNTSSYGLDARAIVENLRGVQNTTLDRADSIDRLVGSLSKNSRSNNNIGYLSLSSRGIHEYGLPSTTMPSDASPTFNPTVDAQTYGLKDTAPSYRSPGAYGPN